MQGLYARTKVKRDTEPTSISQLKAPSAVAQGPCHSISNMNMGTSERSLPTQLKSGLENLSGMEMNDVKVHYNSSQPAQLNALAFAKGNQIHLGPGQERHLPHEAWHVVQQKQGRVGPTTQFKKTQGPEVGEHEREADEMGEQAAHHDAHGHEELSQEHEEHDPRADAEPKVNQALPDVANRPRGGSVPVVSTNKAQDADAPEAEQGRARAHSAKPDFHNVSSKVARRRELIEKAKQVGDKVVHLDTSVFNRMRNSTFTQLQAAIKAHKNSFVIWRLCRLWQIQHSGNNLSKKDKEKVPLVKELLAIHAELQLDDKVQITNNSGWQKTKDPVLKSLFAAKDKFNHLYRAAIELSPMTNVARNKLLEQLYVMQRASGNWLDKNKALKGKNPVPENFLQIEKIHTQSRDLIEHFSNARVRKIKPHEFDALVSSSLAERLGRYLPNETLINTLHEVDAKSNLADDERATKDELHQDNNLGNLTKSDGKPDHDAAKKVVVASYIRKNYNNLKDFDPSIPYKREKVTGTMADAGAVSDAVGAGMELLYDKDSNKDFSLTSGPGSVGYSGASKANAINQTVFTGNHSNWSGYKTEWGNSWNNIGTQLKKLLTGHHSFAETSDHLIRIGGEIHTLLGPVHDVKEVIGDGIDIAMGYFIWQRANHVADHIRGMEEAPSEHEVMMVQLQEEVRWDAVYKAILGLLDLVSKVLTLSGAGAVAGIPMMATIKATKAGVHAKTRLYDRSKYDEGYITIVNGVLGDLKRLPRLGNSTLSQWHHAEIELYGIGVTVPELGSITKLRMLTFKKAHKLNTRKPSMLLRDYLVDMQKARVLKSTPRLKH